MSVRQTRGTATVQVERFRVVATRRENTIAIEIDGWGSTLELSPTMARTLGGALLQSERSHEGAWNELWEGTKRNDTPRGHGRCTDRGEEFTVERKAESVEVRFDSAGSGATLSRKAARALGGALGQAANAKRGCWKESWEPIVRKT